MTARRDKNPNLDLLEAHMASGEKQEVNQLMGLLAQPDQQVTPT